MTHYRKKSSFKTEPKVGNPAVAPLSAIPGTSSELPMLSMPKLEEYNEGGSPAPSEGADSNTSQNWKKKKTSIYLNK